MEEFRNMDSGERALCERFVRAREAFYQAPRESMQRAFASIMHEAAWKLCQISDDYAEWLDEADNCMGD